MLGMWRRIRRLLIRSFLTRWRAAGASAANELQLLNVDVRRISNKCAGIQQLQARCEADAAARSFHRSSDTCPVIVK